MIIRLLGSMMNYPGFLAGNRCYIGEFTNYGFREHQNPEVPGKVYGVMEVDDNTYFRHFFRVHAEIEFWKNQEGLWKELGIAYNQVSSIWLVTDNEDDELYVFASIMGTPMLIGRLKKKSVFYSEVRDHLLAELRKLVVA